MKRTAVIFYVFLNFLLFFVGFFHPITAINEDLGRHLLLGQIIGKTQTVPKVNLLSYTYPQAPFINSHQKLFSFLFTNKVALMDYSYQRLSFRLLLSLCYFSLQ